MVRDDRRFGRGRMHGFGVAAVPLVLSAILLPVLLLLLQGDRLPCTHDNIFHSYRIVAMREMLRHGWLFSRWVPNLALGYGYPFFTYREPLPYLVGEGLYALGVPLPLVLGGLYAVSLVAGAWGAYVLARDLFGPRAAWVSAVAYGLAPYLLMDVLRRGNMPESVGLALVPWLFVAVRRLILHKGRGRFVVVVLLLAALFLSHNISSLLLAPFLGLYVVVLAAVHHDRGGWPYAFAAVAAAVLLTAWFWLPALVEQDVVQLHLSRTTRNNDFHFNFASWREMVLTPAAAYDPAYVNPPMRVSLGVGRAVLGFLGGLLGLWCARPRCCGRARPRWCGRARDRETRWLVMLLILAGVGYLWMATPESVQVWEAAPLLSFIQFPWRLVGRALLPTSLLAGLAVEIALGLLGNGPAPPWRMGEARMETDEAAGGPGRCAGRVWLSAVVVALCVGGLTLSAWPETYPPKGMCGVARYPDLTDLYARELEGWMGMDPESSYFPIWVEDHPEDTALAEAFQESALPARFDAAALPEGGRVVTATYRPLRATVTVDSPERFRARWLGFYYPGWRVDVDGKAVDIAPEDDTGLMRFDVPAGEHTIRVRLGLTPPRAVGAGLALLGAIAVGGLLLVPGSSAGLSAAPEAPPGGGAPGTAGGAPGTAGGGAPSTAGGGVPMLWAVLGVSVGLLALRYGVSGDLQMPWSRSRLAMGALPEVSVPVDQAFAGGMRLLGYDMDQAVLRGDGELAVSLLWQAAQQPARDYRTAVLLRGQDGQIWSPAGTLRPRGYESPPPSRGWAAGSYVYDPHIVIPNPGAPPGEYAVVVALFDAATLAPAAPLDDAGQPSGTDWVVGHITLEPPAAPASLEALGVPPTAEPIPCGPVVLLDFSIDRAIGVPGDLVGVRWVWEAIATPDLALKPRLSLIGPGGESVQTWSLPAVADWWPTSRWTAGQRWAGRHVVRLPGGLESGRYTLHVAMKECVTPLGRVPLEVTAPSRAWSVPEALTPADAQFGGQIRLAGYDITPEDPAEGETVTVTLAWQAVASMETAYRIFVHLVDEAGTLVAQDDGEPAGWSRPTTGWAVGEVVVEERRLALPAEAQRMTLRVGVYAPDGARLPVGDDGDDTVTIGMISVND